MRSLGVCWFVCGVRSVVKCCLRLAAAVAVSVTLGVMKIQIFTADRCIMVLPAFLAPLLAAGVTAGASVLGNAQRLEGQREEIALQKEFAQNGIRWKVDDARKAGIHPAVALGSPTASYNPVGLGDNTLASDFSSMGQDISRAVESTRSAQEQASDYNTRLRSLALTRGELENELLRTQIRRNAIAATPPGPSAYDPVLVPAGDPTGGSSVPAGPHRQGPSYPFDSLHLPMPAGMNDFVVGPGVPAETIESLYGDAAQEIYGLPKFIHDSLVYNTDWPDWDFIPFDGPPISDIVAP